MASLSVVVALEIPIFFTFKYVFVEFAVGRYTLPVELILNLDWES